MSSQIIPLKGRTDFQESSRIPATETIHVFRCGIGDTQLRGRSAADASSLTHPRCCDGGRPIGDARVAQIPSAPAQRQPPLLSTLSWFRLLLQTPDEKTREQRFASQC